VNGSRRCSGTSKEGKMPDEGSPAAAEPTQDSKGRAFMCAHNTRFDHARTALALACEAIVDCVR